MFKYHSPRYKFPVEGVMAGRYEKEARTAHNEYLHLSVEMSPAAVLFLLIALGLLVRTAFTVEWASRPGLPAMSLAAGLVAVALHALFDSNLHEPAIAVLAAVLSGLLVTELSRQGKPMLVELQPGPWARRFLAGLFTGLLLLGVPGYAYLAWSSDHWVRALKEQDYNRELVLLDRAARHSFGNYQPYSHLALAKLRQYYYTRNARRLDDALKAAEQAEHLNPVSSRPPALKGRVFLELFKGSGEATFLDYADSALGRAAGLAPYDIDLVLARAEVSRHRGQLELESEQLASALALEPYDLGARLRLCRSLLSQGRAEEAREQWREFHERKLEIERMKKKRDRFFDSPYRARRIAGDPELEERLQSLFAGP